MPVERDVVKRSGPIRRADVAPKRPKDTGPDGKTRAKVWEREQGCCAACGRVLRPGDWWSIQHRLARGQGGDSSLPNLVLLCGSATSAGCHLRAEQRDPHMHAAGFYVESWEDPRLVPVMLHGEQGGVTVWLDEAGGYSLTAPEAVPS